MDEYNQAIEQYEQKWQALVATAHNAAFFDSLRPTSIGWKVADLAEFDTRFAALRDASDQVHMGWVNERWLATFHLRGQPLHSGIRVVKLMQRRPGSTDAVGLDHLDFYIPTDADAKRVLAREADIKWTEEKNGENCKWLSVWFDGTEAKLRRDTVLQVCAYEMLECQSRLLQA